MSIVAIVQARTGSSRLPGKVLADIAGRPMIEHVLRRAAMSRVDRVVLATSDTPEDAPLAALVAGLGFEVYRGSLGDVLDRYHQAARRAGAEVVVRLTGDCPLLDPEVVDRCLARFAIGDRDYVSNAYPMPSFPDGLDAEAFSASALEKAWREAVKPSEREHVTPYIWSNPRLFRLGAVRCERDLSHWRWTVDESEDLRFAREVFARLENPDAVRMGDVLRLLTDCPELAKINQGPRRNEGYLKSLLEDASVADGAKYGERPQEPLDQAVPGDKS